MNQEHPMLVRMVDTMTRNTLRTPRREIDVPRRYYVALTFHPNQANPAYPSGRGVWRVHHSGPSFGTITRPRALPLDMGEGDPWITLLYLPARREYKKGSRVDPRKVLGV